MRFYEVIWKDKFANKAALPISARDMTRSERRYYERQKSH